MLEFQYCLQFFAIKKATADKVFEADDIARVFSRSFGGMVLSAGQQLVYDHAGHKIRALVKSVSTLELAEEQQRSTRTFSQAPGHERRGILFEKTDISIMKAPDSSIQIKSSAKK